VEGTIKYSNGASRRDGSPPPRRSKSGMTISLSAAGATNTPRACMFRLREAGIPIGSVLTMFDFIDLDEGRPLGFREPGLS
jgi:hypothetical protein